MTQPLEPVTTLPAPPAPSRWPRLIMLASIFLSGAVIGAIGGRVATFQQVQSMLRHPEQVTDRVLPRIRSTLSLSDEQARHVEEIVRRRHAAMEAVRARSYPDLLAEFQAMQSEVSQLLSPDQRERWQHLVTSVEERYLPAPPVADTPQRD